MPKISVIIPVYNTDKYLRECLESVINQTLKDIEIICVNDGSTDNSLQILNEYANKDKRIHIFTQTNSGPGLARNLGLDNAKGEYVAFVDGDDYLGSSHFYENLYNIAKEHNADAVKGLYQNTQTGYINYDINKKINENKNYFIIEYTSAIFKRQVIEENSLRFPDIRDMEDPVFTFLFALKAKNILTTDLSIIKIRQRLGSITAGAPSENQIKQKIKGLNIFLEHSDLLSAEEYGYIIALWFGCIWRDITKNKNLFIFYKSYKVMKQIYNNLKYPLEFEKNLRSINVEAYNLFRRPLYKSLIEEIFSIKNINSHKVITILGLKISISKYKKSFKIQKNVIKKIQNNVRHNSVLLVEINDFHREIMPGYAKYFQDLGYNVDILTTLKKDTEDCFSRVNFQINKYYTTPGTIKEFLTNTKDINKYKYVFFDSYSIFHNAIFCIDIYEYLDIQKDKIPTNWLFVAHTTDETDNDFLLNNKTSILATNILDLPVINPHYFGNIDITKKNKEKTIFLATGDNKKSFESIVNAVEKLLESNITNFEIYITGRFKHKELKNKYKKHIKFLGYVSFKVLYKFVEKSDFIITSLNPENKDHDWYIKYGTSGAFQLSYGFLKPMIIPEKFAQKACVNNKNSIIYTNNEDLNEALKKGIEMDCEKYNKMQEELNIVEKELYNLSLNNLKKLLEVE